MSPQHSNREALIEGTLRCLETLPPEQVTARVIAAASGANLASIGYHFGSKDNLVSEAISEGLHRWLAEVAAGLTDVPDAPPNVRLRRAFQLVDETRQQHQGLAANFLLALARALHDESVRRQLADSYRSARTNVMQMLDLGDDRPGQDAAAVLLATFDGLLIRALLDHEVAIDVDRMMDVGARLLALAPDGAGV